MFELEDKDKRSKEFLEYLKESGVFRYILGDSEEIKNLDDDMPLFTIDDEVFFLIDRISFHNDKETITRLTDSIETAFKLGNGKIIVRNFSNNTKMKYSSRYECSTCDILYQEPEPKLFSFNNPYGACHHCQGFGRTMGIDENLVIPDKSLSLAKGAIHPFRTPGFAEHQRSLLRVATKLGIPIDKPVGTFTNEEIDFLWEGAGDYIGINGFFAMLEEKSYKMHYRIIQSRYRGFTRCKACGGSRIRTSARQVFVAGKNIPELVKMPLDKVLDFFKNIELTDYQLSIAKHVIKEIVSRLELLVGIGLSYLTLDRLSHTLSGGEAQRINLTTTLGSSLVGTLYVLDEPSIGMHPSDTNKLINVLMKLRNLGNTIVVVEHDLDIITKADYIIDLGPGSGENGGQVIFSGTLRELSKNEDSLTGKYIFNKKTINFTEKKKVAGEKKITIINAKENNLKIPKIDIPLGCMVVVTGVSGSGKSTLVHDVLYPTIKPLYASATRETSSDEVILKLVNVSEKDIVSSIKLAGVKEITAPVRALVLTSASPNDENSLEEPKKVSPRATQFDAGGPDFQWTLPGNSVTVLRVKARF
jgi:excinuclease ABC subunit A